LPRSKKKLKKKDPQFLVDYDLPKNRCRKKFYRKLKDPKLKGKKSTMSVLLMNDLKKAKAIHKKAKRCGKSNLYKVVKKLTA
jgi:hypothetical protein